jgi:hypothetical protein
MASMPARNVDISPCPRTSGFGVRVNIAKLWKRSTREKNELGWRPRDLHEAVLFTLEGLPIESRLPSALGGICSEKALRFSRRWSGEDVPGISSMLGERWRSQASASFEDLERLSYQFFALFPEAAIAIASRGRARVSRAASSVFLLTGGM